MEAPPFQKWVAKFKGDVAWWPWQRGGAAEAEADIPSPRVVFFVVPHGGDVAAAAYAALAHYATDALTRARLRAHAYDPAYRATVALTDRAAAVLTAAVERRAVLEAVGGATRATSACLLLTNDTTWDAAEAWLFVAPP